MGDASPSGGIKLSGDEIRVKNAESKVKKNKVVIVSMAFVICGLMLRIWNAQPVFYAHAYTSIDADRLNSDRPSFLENPKIFMSKGEREKLAIEKQLLAKKQNADLKKKNEPTGELAQKLYAIVGETPIKEMIPFISNRDETVAAFLVGIAKKESSFGFASPSKNGETCYNYWGYKGSAGRGSSMGYACFASAEEAIETVGNRIEVLVKKNRNTPARMVNTWKCGMDCSGDPGAPSWVSTVAAYFNKIVS